MGNFIGILLYATGYTYDYKENINEPPLVIRSAPNDTYVPRQVSAAKRSRLTKIPGFCYNSLIVLIMGWRIVYSIYMSIRDKNFLHFGRMVFQILFIIQYIIGINYFRKDHFYKNITNKSDMIRKFEFSIPFTIVIALILSITMTVVMTTGHNIHGYTEAYNDSGLAGKIFMAVLLFVDSFYSYLTFAINTCVFTVNMLYQKKMVSGYRKSLSEYIQSSQDGEAKVESIADDYALTKDGWDQTVGVLNYFFVFLNFVGFLAIYFYLQVINEGDISADEVANFIMFIIIDIIYIVSINNVYRDIGRISDTIGCTALLVQYFANEQDDRHSLTFAGRLRRLDVEMGALHNSLSGAPHVVIDTRPSTSLSDERDSGSTGSTDGAGYDFDALKPAGGHPDEIYMTDPNVNASIRKILTTVTGIQNMANWMSLQGVAGAQWKTFRLFGVQLTDTTLISRIFGLLVALGIGSELVSVLNWY
jgi:hypothetical protein